MKYRTYDSAWNRTGYADEPQYPGQAGLTKDYPPNCHCGAQMLGCGDAEWLVLRAWTAPDWVRNREGYAAWCQNGHEMALQTI